ncbi:MAG: hypothetical protein RLY31_1779 [Bacteroidota bacterium]|jgi:exonuclease SbcC
MKILSISLRNLASLEGEHTINFTQTPLRQTGIFAITGRTGAGKTTILDALCLALYGKVPRLENPADRDGQVLDAAGEPLSKTDVRTLLRKGTAEGWARVEFTGVDQQRYRSSWCVHRAHHNVTGNLQPYTLSLKRCTAVDELLTNKRTEHQTYIERLVGLNFQQFSRSVLLAQGEFSAFLQSNSHDRSLLLEKLTGTEIFSRISRQVHEKTAKAKQTLQQLQQQCNLIRVLSEEKRAELSGEITTLGQQLATHQQQIAAIQAGIQWHTTLQQLSDEEQAAVARLEEIQAEWDASSDRFRQLDVVLSVQEARPLVENRLRLWEEKEKTKQDLANADGRHRTEAERLHVLMHDLADRTTALQTTEQMLRDMQPHLQQARQLDSLVAAQQQQLDQSAAQLADIRHQLATQQAAFDKLDLETNADKTALADRQAWKNNRAALRTIQENQSLVLQQLQEAENLLPQLQTADIDERNAREKLRSAELALANEEKILAAHRTTHTELEKQHASLEASGNLTVELAELTRQRTRLEQEHRHLLDAVTLWERISHNRSTEEQLLTQADEWSARQPILQAALVSLNSLLRDAQVRQETTARLLNQVRLELSAGVTGLRQTLESDTPCPVCGSTHHPYRDSEQLPHPAVEPLQKAADKAAKDVAEHQQTLLKQQLEVQTLMRQQQENEQQRQTLQQQRQALLSEWDRLAIAPTLADVADNQRQEWLASAGQTCANALRACQEAEQQILRRQSEKNQVLQAWQESNQQLQQLEINQLNLRNQQDALREQHRNRQADHQRLQQQKDTLRNNLQPVLTSDNWMESFQSDPARFRQRLLDGIRQWSENEQAISELNTRLQASENRKTGLSDTIGMLRNQLRQAESHWQTIRHVLLQYQSDRSLLLGGRSAEEAESQAQQAVQTARNNREKAREASQQADTALAVCNNDLQSLQRALRQLQSAEKEADDKVQAWLNNFRERHQRTLDPDDLSALLKHPDDWIQIEQAFRQACHDRRNQQSTIVAVRRASLEQHRSVSAPYKPLPDLEADLPSLQKSCERTQQELAEARQQLQQDEQNRREHAAASQQMDRQQEETDRWSSLDSLIGSAEGQAFRNIAQQFTLDELVRHANRHLETIVRRYTIQRIPDSLGLQVVDQEMGAEIRSVLSLSGGETFLVSLALALGLASLSAERVPVESLFIDEGFGSLDPESLHQALDALERLHETGRKVGVISHVQEMTERIPVRIHVRKVAHGRSQLEISG